LGLGLLVPGWLWRDRARLPEGAVWGGAVLAGMAASTLVVSALADVYDQFRHQVVAFALFDMLLVAVVWLVSRAGRRTLRAR